MPHPENKDSASDTNDVSDERTSSGKTTDASGSASKMSERQRTAIVAGIVGGMVVATALIWWLGGPTQATVQRTIVTTVQQETPASTLITGRLSMTTTVAVDSTSPVTPMWLTSVIQTTQPQLMPFTLGTASAKIRVPGTVSYGFDVRQLTPEMIRLVEDDIVEVRLPPLNVQSVEPDLQRMEMQTASSGWMKMFTGNMEEDVRKNALSKVADAFRAQAESRINSTNQPGINTARALQSMLTPPLKAAGVDNPRFRFRIREDLVLTLDPSKNDVDPSKNDVDPSKNDVDPSRKDVDEEPSSTRLPQPSGSE